MKKLLLPLFAILSGSPLPAQQQSIHKANAPLQQKSNPALTAGEAPRKKCATVPGIHQDYETWIGQQIKKDNAFANDKKISTIYNIPVVFHIIHSGQAVGVGYNISQAQVNSQVVILNQDYSKTNTNFTSWVTQSAFISAAADLQIQFCLATIRPDGSTLSEPGIDRVSTVQKGWAAPPYASPPASNYIESTIKPGTIWDPSKYLNIWVLSFNDGTLGYAQFPNVPSASTPTIGDMYGQGGGASTDGVAFDYTAIGNTGAATSPYDLGRTASHEIGHFFGLYHPNGDTNCGDDYCADTPTLSQLSGTCPSTPGQAVASGCAASPNPPGKMYQNFMDYSDDACLALFTNDQKARMMACIQYCSQRNSLTTSNACAIPNAIVENSSGIRAVSVYPNPTNGELKVSVDAANIDHYTIVVMNTLGQSLSETRMDYTAGNSSSISLDGYAKGIYMVKIDTGKGIVVKRIILQ